MVLDVISVNVSRGHDFCIGLEDGSNSLLRRIFKQQSKLILVQCICTVDVCFLKGVSFGEVSFPRSSDSPVRKLIVPRDKQS